MAGWYGTLYGMYYRSVDIRDSLVSLRPGLLISSDFTYVIIILLNLTSRISEISPERLT
jgi:hypothetical protein